MNAVFFHCNALRQTGSVPTSSSGISRIDLGGAYVDGISFFCAVHWNDFGLILRASLARDSLLCFSVRGYCWITPPCQEELYEDT